jgi:hypothetical protein
MKTRITPAPRHFGVRRQRRRFQSGRRAPQSERRCRRGSRALLRGHECHDVEAATGTAVDAQFAARFANLSRTISGF